MEKDIELNMSELEELIDNKNTAPQTIDENGVILADTYTKEVPLQDMVRITEVLTGLGFADRVSARVNGTKAVITLSNITEDELNVIERKINISNWSVATIEIAHKVSNFATDVADYALNGALAPTAVAVADATLTAGRVVGTAAIKAAAGITASALINGQAAVKEVWNSSEIKECGTQLKNVWNGISGKIFGKSASSSWTKVAA